MSVTIRYQGSLSAESKAKIEELQEEFLDIAITSAWPSEIVDGAYSSLKAEAFKGRARGSSALKTLKPALTLRGIKLTVNPQTDPLWFTFDADSNLTRLSYYAVDHYPGRAAEAMGPSRRYEFVHQSQASIQTTLGGVELHLCVIRLLDRLKAGYVPDLEVSDDSGYWGHRDEALLKAALARR